jgi:hypothetical protein
MPQILDRAVTINILGGLNSAVVRGFVSNGIGKEEHRVETVIGAINHVQEVRKIRRLPKPVNAHPQNGRRGLIFKWERHDSISIFNEVHATALFGCTRAND